MFRCLTMSRLALAVMATAAAHAATATSVTTYHYDNLRTGWNSTETILTPTTVASPAFGLVRQVHLDEQVDAQPLYVPNQMIAGTPHNVVYVATENNTIYAIDADTGERLIIKNYGKPVPITALPSRCDNNSTRVGFNSTPVYDPATNLIYGITYTYEPTSSTSSAAVFRLHQIDARTLQDRIPPVVVSAAAPRADGVTISFSAPDARQRPALLLNRNRIYAGFGGWCDVDRDRSRGWVLGWEAHTLKPLPNTYLVNRNITSRLTFFLSDVWMSGAGLAADPSGSVYFVTGNSDRTGKSWSVANDLEESVVKLSGDLSTLDSYFTPSDIGTNQVGYAALDAHDLDFGAGGVLLLPQQPGAVPSLAVAAGKAGPLYLLNRASLGGFHPQQRSLGTYVNDGSFCGASYYAGSDGIGRVVESSGDVVRVWRVVTSASAAPTLVLESTSPALGGGQDPGFFTSVSSDGQHAGTAIVWALPHPNGSDTSKIVNLMAFDPAHGARKIFSAAAGTWARVGSSNANLVPVVADGHVLVASYDELAIFGLTSPATPRMAFKARPEEPLPVYADAPHRLHGFVVLADGQRFTLKTRAGKLVRVDATGARANPPRAGSAVTVYGTYDAGGAFIAKYALRAKATPLVWDSDI